MKYKGYDDHVLSVQTIGGPPVDPKEEQRIADHSLTIFKKVNGWSLRFSVDYLGKLELLASKAIGRTTSGFSTEAKIELILETVEHRVPELKIAGGASSYGDKGQWVELNDQKGRVTESFKEENKYYKREFGPESSIVTASELLTELIPSYEALLSDKAVNDFCSKLKEEAGQIQKPYNRNYHQIN